MQTNALSVRYAQQRAFSPKQWLDAKSELFTRLCGETVTRCQVLRVHAILLFMGMAMITAEASFVASLLFLALAAHHVYKFNQEDEQQTNKQTLEQKGGAR